MNFVLNEMNFGGYGFGIVVMEFLTQMYEYNGIMPWI